ncbi:FecR domain-containing protein [Gemmatimonas sp.]|uniref:FecR family protein n=2 Tax=Gemmatimonas sp. TaxID=1962908 RepID=UPI0025C2B1D9|nr:FecR domain-containing protein [Gemmatimonas sp.]MCA2993320.1 FecR domain-containing protein [Gemmatimonas sp.]
MSDRPDELRPSSGLPPDADWEAIARHLAGESDPTEASSVRSWLATHAEDARLVDLVKVHAANAEQRADVTVDTERALAAVRARMGAEAAAPRLSVERGGSPGAANTPAVPPARRRWSWVAGALAAGVAAVAALSQFRSAPGAGAPREYRTAVGQRDSVRLPDGSMVVLAPGSRLVVAAAYGVATRDVELDGAAYFDVKHDAAHPFAVHTASADIRDIGTAFAVKTSEGGEVAVDVTHGIVALSAARSTVAPVELHAGDRGVLVREGVSVRRGTVTADDVAWTRGLLSYRDASLTEVRADVRRWYGIDLRVPDSALAARTLTASFRGDSATQVLRVIALALGAELVQRGDTVTLQPQGVDSSTPR